MTESALSWPMTGESQTHLGLALSRSVTGESQTHLEQSYEAFLRKKTEA
jgi:hypothetical protein